MLSWKETPLGWHARVAVWRRARDVHAQVGTMRLAAATYWFLDCRATNHGLTVELRDNKGSLPPLPPGFEPYEYLNGFATVVKSTADCMLLFEQYLDKLIPLHIVDQVTLK